LAFWSHIPLQSWVPEEHTPEHGAALSMQVPAHSFIPAGHAGTQLAPSQLTVPPTGA
jgi:hypothetical protein